MYCFSGGQRWLQGGRGAVVAGWQWALGWVQRALGFLRVPLEWLSWEQCVSCRWVSAASGDQAVPRARPSCARCGAFSLAVNLVWLLCSEEPFLTFMANKKILFLVRTDRAGVHKVESHGKGTNSAGWGTAGPGAAPLPPPGGALQQRPHSEVTPTPPLSPPRGPPWRGRKRRAPPVGCHDCRGRRPAPPLPPPALSDVAARLWAKAAPAWPAVRPTGCGRGGLLGAEFAVSLPPSKETRRGRAARRNYARGARATMQWRSLVLGLLLLRLGLHALLALLPALAPGLCLRLRLPFPFPPRSAALGPPGAARPLPGGGSSHWGSLRGGGGAAGRDEYETRYSAAFPPQLRARLRDAARGMFAFGYDSYMQHAFPSDELDPLHCCGRGPDRDDPWVGRGAAGRALGAAVRGWGRRSAAPRRFRLRRSEAASPRSWSPSGALSPSLCGPCPHLPRFVLPPNPDLVAQRGAVSSHPEAPRLTSP